MGSLRTRCQSGALGVSVSRVVCALDVVGIPPLFTGPVWGRKPEIFLGNTPVYPGGG